MPVIFFEQPLLTAEWNQIQKEFPFYHLVGTDVASELKNRPTFWEEVEIVFGEELTLDQLKWATQLRWVHVPSACLNNLCLFAIQERENIIVTQSEEDYKEQQAEFAIAGFGAFSKNLFLAKNDNSEEVLKKGVQLFRKKIWLQVGLEKAGGEIARVASLLGMEVWGVNENGSFNPNCQRTFAIQGLHALLPAADVVCLTTSADTPSAFSLSSQGLSLIKEGAILEIFAPKERVDIEALKFLIEIEKLKGVLWDTEDPEVAARLALIIDHPLLLLTKGLSKYPIKKEPVAFRLFRHNLRQFVHDNFQDMLGVVKV